MYFHVVCMFPQLVLERNVDTLVEFCVQALGICQPWTFPDVLRALGALLYENSGRVSKVGVCVCVHAYMRHSSALNLTIMFSYLTIDRYRDTLLNRVSGTINMY